jgi:imidazolonepropionase-like amidohydrolase
MNFGVKNMATANRLFWTILLFPALVAAQVTFPKAQLKDPQLTTVAITHATIWVDENLRYHDATLLIKDGMVADCGNNVTIPAHAVIIDVMGAYIYPSFIDPFSTYGIQAAKEGWYKKQATSVTGWNTSIRSANDAFEFFAPDEKRSAALLEMGYGCTSSLVRDGIARGSSALVLLGGGSENELIVSKQSAAHFSFNKGSSPNIYPGSLMGSIALLRQTYYDADWYAKGGNKIEYNYALERMNLLKELPQIFETENKLSLLRAQKIASEFGLSYIIKGAGDEYLIASQLKALGTKVIIPVALPKPFRITNQNKELISTRDLRHWNTAPYNAHILAKAEVPFSFTAEEVSDPNTFWKNIRLMMKCGMDEKTLLRGMCTNPSLLLKADALIGSLKPGHMANFIICSNPLSNEHFVLLENWIKGKRTVLKGASQKIFEGTYTFTNGKMSITKTELMYISNGDTCIAPWVTVKGKSAAEFVLLCNKKSLKPAYLWVSLYGGNYPKQAMTLNLIYDGKTVIATREESNAEKRKLPDDSWLIPGGSVANWYPFADYGSANPKPEKEFVLFKNATIWTGESEGILYATDMAIGNGKIMAIGKNLDGAKVFGKIPFTSIDATGKHVTAGIIDEHSHIAIENGVNECTQAVTSEVRIGDVLNNEDINIFRQLAGGVTCAHLLHGSCNPIGGQTQLIKLRWGNTPEEMKFEGWGGFIKFALGENVKRGNWDDPSHRFPQTRMGVEQIILDAFNRAKKYGKEKELAQKNKSLFRIDLELEALLEILTRQRFITCHSYVQSEISMLINLADSIGFKVNTFTHVLEGYKVADKIKAHGAAASTFADWWAYKYEVIDAIPYNAAILNKIGVVTAINSDDAEMGRRLNQEAAKSVKYGNMSKESAWKMVTLNPAKMLHVDHRVGSLKIGKDADVVLWSDEPLSIYAKVEKTYIDGRCYFDLAIEKLTNETLKKEREFLLVKMMEAIKMGEDPQDGFSIPEIEYQCEN